MSGFEHMAAAFATVLAGAFAVGAFIANERRRRGTTMSRVEKFELMSKEGVVHGGRIIYPAIHDPYNYKLYQLKSQVGSRMEMVQLDPDRIDAPVYKPVDSATHDWLLDQLEKGELDVHLVRYSVDKGYHSVMELDLR
jgi:hypothetical protein